MALELDDFSTGAYEYTNATEGEEVKAAQTGTMVGGWRLIKISSNPNVRHQPYHVDISNQVVPSGVLTLTVGTTSTVHLGLHYGFGDEQKSAPLRLDLSRFSEFVIDFDCLWWSGTKVNIYYWSADGKRTAFGKEVGRASTSGVRVSMPFQDIPPNTNAANANDVTKLWFGFTAIAGLSIQSLALG